MYFSSFRLASVATLAAFASAARGDGFLQTSSSDDYSLHIKTAEELIEFSNMVKKGEDVSMKTTVYLDNDIDFAGGLSAQFVPIGGASINDFKGSFDGQGYRISNLIINETELYYSGLFGSVYRSGIKNFVLDSSCAINVANTYSRTSYIGVIGYYSCHSGVCEIENIINMADININTPSFYAGGIVGKFYSGKGAITVRNCANFGTISASKKTTEGCVGGIVGVNDIYHGERVTIANCINYGNIDVSGILGESIVGGICGDASTSTVMNCVNMGTMHVNSDSSVGHIAGKLDPGSAVRSCYWVKVDDDASYGKLNNSTTMTDCSSFEDSIFELDELITVGSYTGTSLVAALNAFADKPLNRFELSKWLLNENRTTVKFNYAGELSSLELDSPVILMPKLANYDLMVFYGWYSDEACTVPFDSYEITEDVELYGIMKKNLVPSTVTFDTRGGTPIEPIVAQYKAVVELPYTSQKDGFDIMWWETEFGDIVSDNFVVPLHNVTLYAVWIRTHMKTAEDLIELANLVNNEGITYSSLTVYLDADIYFTDELSKEFNPIGNRENENAYFAGNFDGQGYIISNLKYDKLDGGLHNGLFGYVKSKFIRNVVLDSTCSFSATYSKAIGSLSATLGGIVGEFDSELHSISYTEPPALFESCIDMAKISVINMENSSIDNFAIGGILGLESASNEFMLKNCANYGDISYTGKNASIKMGGIAGFVSGYARLTFANNINYGYIKQVSPIKSAYIGGIIGHSNIDRRSMVENCINLGKITEGAKYAGAIIGYSEESWYLEVNNSFWTDEAGIVDAIGSGYVEKSNTFKVDITEEFVKELNERTKKYFWTTWIYNEYGRDITFTVSDNSKGWTVEGKEIVMVTKLADSVEHPFSGWFLDSNYDKPLESIVYYVSSDQFYGKWCDIAVRYAAYSSSIPVQHKGVTYGKPYGEFPRFEMKGHSSTGWMLDGVRITSDTLVTTNKTHTVYCEFKPNRYELTFVLGYIPDITLTIPYDDRIVYPNVSRKGYKFVGWNETFYFMPDHDLTIEAIWEKDTASSSKNILTVFFSAIAIVVIIVVVVAAAVVFFNSRGKGENPAGGDENGDGPTIVKIAADGEPGAVLVDSENEPALNNDAGVPLATITINADDFN